MGSGADKDMLYTFKGLLEFSNSCRALRNMIEIEHVEQAEKAVHTRDRRDLLIYA